MNKHTRISYKYKLDKATGEFIPTELRMGNHSVANLRHGRTSDTHRTLKLGFTFPGR